MRYGPTRPSPSSRRCTRTALINTCLGPQLSERDDTVRSVQREPYLLECSGPHIAFVGDPDGNSIELIQR